jgi:hypothetical protein
MLAHTGPAARAVLYRINKLPRAQRLPELNRVLARFEPGLPSRVHRTAEFLQRRGMLIDAAVERALALSLADATIERFKKVGIKARQGRMFPVGGMGGLGTEGESDAPEDVLARMAQGIACSPDLATSTTGMVGRAEGADAAGATQIGFAVVRGVAMCPPGTTPEPPVTPPPETPEERSLVLPIVLSVGALAAVGGVVWFMARKK